PGRAAGGRRRRPGNPLARRLPPLRLSARLRVRPGTASGRRAGVGWVTGCRVPCGTRPSCGFAVGKFEDVTAADESAGAVGGHLVEGPFGDSDVSVDERGPVVAFPSVIVGEDCGEPASHLVLAAVGGARLGADR